MLRKHTVNQTSLKDNATTNNSDDCHLYPETQSDQWLSEWKEHKNKTKEQSKRDATKHAIKGTKEKSKMWRELKELKRNQLSLALWTRGFWILSGAKRFPFLFSFRYQKFQVKFLSELAIFCWSIILIPGPHSGSLRMVVSRNSIWRKRTPEHV